MFEDIKSEDKSIPIANDKVDLDMPAEKIKTDNNAETIGEMLKS
jgi:hypothetical protein